MFLFYSGFIELKVDGQKHHKLQSVVFEFCSVYQRLWFGI